MTINSWGDLTPNRKLLQTHSEHYHGSASRMDKLQESSQIKSNGFGNLVTDALKKVSDLQIDADTLFEKMLTHPDEVQPHEVSIAISKAELGLNITWAVVDRAVKAYNNITSMR